MLLPSRNPFKYHEEDFDLQPMIPPKRVDIFPPDWGICSEGLDAFRFFFKDRFQESSISLANGCPFSRIYRPRPILENQILEKRVFFSKSENGPISDFKNPGFRTHENMVWFSCFLRTRTSRKACNSKIKFHATTVYYSRKKVFYVLEARSRAQESCQCCSDDCFSLFATQVARV